MVDYVRLDSLRQDALAAEGEIKRLLVGRKVAFKGWRVAGKFRTGVINHATIGSSGPPFRLGFGIGVAVDREDGRPGSLADTWYGDLNAVNIIEGDDE